MKRLFLFLVLINSVASAQVLRDINYRYLYTPETPFAFDMKVVLTGNQWTVHYALETRDNSPASYYLIQWGTRLALSDKTAQPVGIDSVQKNLPTERRQSGKVMIPVSGKPVILMAVVLNNSFRQAWTFYKILEPAYPVNGGLKSNEDVVLKPFLMGGQEYGLMEAKLPAIVSFYAHNFPSATPVFSVSMGKVSPRILPDSVYSISSPDSVSFPRDGLYLVQHDTLSKEGFAFRVQNDYPKFSKVESLADPLIYVCTRQEYTRLKAVKGDKKAFDRIVVGIIGDTERAKIFMRSYFRRVEWANYYFTSYKEGWKTDRGMVYIIFGVPNEVFKFSDREVWNYKNDSFTVSFDFTPSPTLFDPDNYVLVRDKKYEQTLYEVIDLWRKARF